MTPVEKHIRSQLEGKAEIVHHGAESSYGARTQLEPAVLAAGEVALLVQLTLDSAQRVDVVERAAAERPLHGVLVDVIERRAGIVLSERRLQVVGLPRHGRDP